MSFGFSPSDIISCTKLAVTTYQALKSAPAEFRSLSLEVNSLTSTLKALEEEATSEYSIIHSASDQRKKSLGELLENLHNGLHGLQYLVRNYNGLEDSDKKRLRFSLKDKKKPRDRLTIHVSSLSIFLTSLTHSSLGRLEILVRELAAGGSGAHKSLSLENGVVDQRKATFVKAWSELGETLWGDGVRLEHVKTFDSEIARYVHHLSKGGKTYDEVRETLELNQMTPGLRQERHFQSGSVPTNSKEPRPLQFPRLVGGDSQRASDLAVKKKRLKESRRARKAREAELIRQTRDNESEAVAPMKGRELHNVTERGKKTSANPEVLPAKKEVESLVSHLNEPASPKPEETKAGASKKSPRLSPWSSMYSPSVQAARSNTNDKVEELVKIFEGLFELDDHTSDNESPSESPIREQNPSRLGLAGPSPYLPSSSEQSSPFSEAPSPSDPSAKYELTSPIDLNRLLSASGTPASVPIARSGHRASSSSSDRRPSPTKPGTIPVIQCYAREEEATKLDTCLRHLSQAHACNDKQTEADLTLHAIPSSIASLRSYNVPIYTCNWCTLPITWEYYSGCLACDAKICADCNRCERTKSYSGQRNCRHESWEMRCAESERKYYWSTWVRDEGEKNSRQTRLMYDVDEHTT